MAEKVMDSLVDTGF